MGNVLISPTIDKNFYTVLPAPYNPAPLILSAGYQDLVPNYLFNVQKVTSIGLWVEVQAGTSLTFKIMAAKDKDAANFYVLPVQLVFNGNVTVSEQEFRFVPVGSETRFVISFALADIIKYCKILVKGSGQINSADVSFKGLL